MHGTHLSGQIIATRFVLGAAIPADLSNGTIQWIPGPPLERAGFVG